VLDDGLQQVRRGREIIDLPRLSYRLLIALAEVAPDVLDHDGIAQHVWSGRIVSPETVTQRVKLLRQALHDDARAPRYIGLVRSEGYRLLAEVEELEPLPVLRPSVPVHPFLRRVAAIMLAGIALATAASSYLPDRSGAAQWAAEDDSGRSDEKSIAVLPFVDMSDDTSLDYLRYGIADEILHRLSQNRDLHVVARTSSFALADRNVTIENIRSLLGVRYVLQGSARRSGESIRITAQLVDTRSSGQVWSRAYDIGLLGALEVEDAIATELAQMLDVRLASPHDGQHPVVPEAYERFMLAEFIFSRRGEGDAARAEELYREAAELDPDFARAWVGLAGALYVQHLDRDADPDALLAQEREAIERALALEPDLAEAHMRLGDLYEQMGDAEGARSHFDAAWELDPNSPLILATRAGRIAWLDLDEAIRLQRRAVALNPLAASNRQNLAAMLMSRGLLEEAEIEINRTTALVPGSERQHVVDLATIRLLQRRFAEALALADQVENPLDRDALYAMACRGLGREEQSTTALARLDGSDQLVAEVRAAEVRAFAGDAAAVVATIEALERSSPLTAQEEGRLWVAWMTLRFSPFFAEYFEDESLVHRVYDAVWRREKSQG
jgi:TolB-like protein/DNA-binding winged helix-turn-helix (wHTH) protein